MAISRKTQKDVGKYQAKLIGPLTVRNAIFVGIAVVVAVIIWNLGDVMQIAMTDKIAIILVISTPITMLGIVSPYGMTCIEFIKQYYEYHILSSNQRIYVTVTDDERMMEQQAKLAESNNHGTKSKEANAKQKKITKPAHQKSKEFSEYR